MRVFVIAGEPSGDVLGAELMRGLRARQPDITFVGVGGPMMAEQGLESLFPMSDLGVIGVVEILPRLRMLLRRIRQTADDVIETAPDLLLTVDAPGFCLRVASKVKAARPNIPVIHYVAPSVWAWRPNRARLMAAYVDHVLALLPFEPPYMEAERMGCDFVGHPAATLPRPGPDAQAAFRREIGDPQTLLCVLPGSRKGEVRRLLPVFAASVRMLAEDVPGLAIVAPAAGPVVEDVRNGLSDMKVPVHVLDPTDLGPEEAERRKLLAFASADAALAASGTVSLELAAMGCPSVIGYRMNHLTSLIVRRLIRVKSATLVNILTDSMVVPEYLQEFCTPEALSMAVRPLLKDPAARDAQREAANDAMVLLGRGGPPPGQRAADAVLAALAGPLARADQG